MNTYLIIYLGILLFEAILSTILKYAWQAEDKWDEPFYNQKTEQERNSSPVSSLTLNIRGNHSWVHSGNRARHLPLR